MARVGADAEERSFVKVDEEESIDLIGRPGTSRTRRRSFLLPVNRKANSADVTPSLRDEPINGPQQNVGAAGRKRTLSMAVRLDVERLSPIASQWSPLEFREVQLSFDDVCGEKNILRRRFRKWAPYRESVCLLMEMMIVGDQAAVRCSTDGPPDENACYRPRSSFVSQLDRFVELMDQRREEKCRELPLEEIDVLINEYVSALVTTTASAKHANVLLTLSEAPPAEIPDIESLIVEDERLRAVRKGVPSSGVNQQLNETGRRVESEVSSPNSIGVVFDRMRLAVACDNNDFAVSDDGCNKKWEREPATSTRRWSDDSFHSETCCWRYSSGSDDRSYSSDSSSSLNSRSTSGATAVVKRSGSAFALQRHDIYESDVWLVAAGIPYYTVAALQNDSNKLQQNERRRPAGAISPQRFQDGVHFPFQNLSPDSELD